MASGWRTKIDTQLRNMILKHGVAVMGVGPGHGPTEPSFVYTVGLARLNVPELIIVGLAMDRSHAILNHLAATVMDGARYHHGDTIHNLADGYATRLVQVNPLTSARKLTLSNRFYRTPGGPPVPALQLVYPDVNHLFPWEKGSRLSPAIMLGPPPGEGEGSEHTLPDLSPEGIDMTRYAVTDGAV